MSCGRFALFRKPDVWKVIAAKDSAVQDDVLGTWNTYGLQGTWFIRLTAYDEAGNKSSTTVIVDLGERNTLVKEFSVTPRMCSPNNDQKADDSEIRYEVTAACQVKVEIVDQAGTLVRSKTALAGAAGVDSFVWDGKRSDGTVAGDGIFRVKLTATLASNPAVSQEEMLTLVVDSSPPVIDFQQPADKAYLNRTELAVIGSINDSNLATYNVSYSGPDGTATLEGGNQSRDSYAFGTIDNLKEGAFSVTIEGKDLAENSSKTTSVFTIDRTPPKISLDSPKAGDYYGSSKNVVNVVGAIVEKNLERFSLRYGPGEAPTEWKEVVGGDTVPSVPQIYSWKVGKDDGISDGVYALSLYAKDMAGLEGEARVRVTVDNTPPAVAFTSLHDGDYVKGPIEISGDLKDANLDRGVLELAEGGCTVAVKWSPLRSYTAPVSGGVLESWKILPTDGDYCLRLSAVDKSGNKASAMVGVKIVTHPPAPPQLAGKIDGKTNAILTWARSSEPDVAGYNVYRDGQKLNTALITDINYTDVNLKDGTYVYTLKAVNQAGTESSVSNSVSVIIDTVGPEVLFSFPQSGAKINDLVSVKGTAYSYDNFKEYRLFVGQGQNPASWSLLRKSPLPVGSGILTGWDTTVLSDGAYSLKLEAEDLSGNVAWQIISVTVDNTPPSPPVLLSATANGADVTLTWNANTEADLAGYLLYRNDMLANGSGITVNSFKPYLIAGSTYLDKALPDGKYTYYMVAMDQAGNVGNISNSLSMSIDVRSPHALITEPVNNSKLEQKVMLKAESADNDIASIQFRFKKTQDSAWTSLGASLTSRPFVTYFDPSTLGLSYGTLQIQCIATDAGGKIDPAPASISVTYTDLTPPAIPTGLQAVTNGNGVTLTWNANAEPDFDGYNLYRTNGMASSKINATPIKSMVYLDANLPDGIYGYAITSVDTYGNESKPSGSVQSTVYGLRLVQPISPVTTAIMVTGDSAKPNDTIELFRETATGHILIGTTVADAQGNFALGTIPLVKGENRITARATDSAGNVSRPADAITVVYVEPPLPPTGLSAATQNQSVKLTWNPNSENDLAGYNIYEDDRKINPPAAITSGQVTALGYYQPMIPPDPDCVVFIPSADPRSRGDVYVPCPPTYAEYYQPSMAFDADTTTAWQSFPRNAFTPVWWQVDFPAYERISNLDVLWLNDAIKNYSGKDFEVQAWSGQSWVTLTRVSGNAASTNTFDFNPPYRTNSVRISINDTNSSDYLKQVGIAEVRIVKESLVTQTSYQAVNLKDGKHKFKVTAVNIFSLESLPSQEANADIGDVTPPTAPEGLVASPLNSSVILGWMPNSESDLAGYNIYLKLPSGWQKLNTALLAGVSFTDQNHVNGTYTYHITAVDRVGNESDPSADAAATVALELLPPGNPTVTPVPSGKALAIVWDASGGPTASFNIYRGLSSAGGYQRIATVPGTVFTYQDSGLVNGTVYYYVIAAVDGIGNESANSIEASGVPVDTVAPAKPLIFDPVLVRGEVRVYRGSTDVAGTAEPGSTVELFKDNTSVGKAVALPSETTEKIHVNPSGADASPSPDGQYIVYTDSSTSALMIMDVSSGTADKIVGKGWISKWSLDGDKVAFRYTEGSNIRIGIYDLEAKKAMPLTEHQTVDEGSPSWSGDGSKIAYSSTKGDSSKRIWVKDLVTGSETQTALSGNNPAISPDGEKVAFFNGAALLVADLADGTTKQVYPYTDGSTLSWAADGNNLLFVSSFNGKFDLYVMDLTAQSQSQVTTDGTYKFHPSWSPDKQSVVYGAYETSGGLSVWLTDLHGQKRSLKNIDSLTGLVWSMDGTIVFCDGYRKDMYIHNFPGQFVFKDLNINPGENVFTTTATDEAGNVGPSSDAISVVFDTARLPDLSVSSDDLYIYPLFPKPGEDVTVDAVVTNVSNSQIDNLEVDIYLSDSTGSLQLVGSETITHLNGNSSEAVAVKVNAGSNTGVKSIIVNVDPSNKHNELLESNNFSSKEFYVTDKEEVVVTAILDSSQYSSNQEVSVNASLRNSGMAKEGVLNVSVEDGDGNRVASLESVQTTVSYGSDNRSYKWNTGATFAGSYRLHAEFRGTDGTVTESGTPFTILPDIRIESGVVTDKQGYGANDSVAVALNLKNSGSNYLVPQLKAMVRIVDAHNATLFSDEKIVRNLFPAMDSSLFLQWDTGLNLPGDYRVVLEAYLDDKLVASSFAPFAIKPVSKVSGTVTVDPATVLIGSNLKISFTVANSGNIGASGSVKAVIVSPESGAILATAEQPVTLATNGSQAGEFTFPTQGLELKSYLVSLQYLSQGGQKSIASASFSVKDGTPPTVTIVSPLAGTSYNTTVFVVALASDNASGVERVEYQVDSGVWKNLPLADPAKGRYAAAWEPTIAVNGPHTVSFRAVDRAGNMGIAVPVGFDIQMDSIPPVTTITVGEPQYEANGNLYVSSATLFTLAASDDYSGVAKTEYRIDDGQWLTYAPFGLTGEGEHLLYYRSVDNAGNAETEKSLKGTLDNTPPTTVLAASDPLAAGAVNTVSQQTVFTLTATDNLAGVKGIWYRIDDGQWQLFAGGFTLAGLNAGSHAISFSTCDNVGNDEIERTITVRLILAEVSKEISLDPVILVGAWEDGANKVKNQNAIDTLSQILSSLGISYHVAGNGDDFKLSIRSGRYTTYILVDYKDEKVGAELREAINYGDGLIFMKTKPSADADMNEIFGVKLTGKTTSDNLTVHLFESPIGGEETLQGSGKPVVIGEILANTVQVFGQVDDKHNLYPALVFNEYGSGKVVLFTFDLLGSPDKEKVAALIGNSITLLKPERHNVRALGSLPMRIAVSGSTEPIGLMVRETIPAGTFADTIVPQGAATDTTITWLESLEASTVADFRYYLNLPDAKGEYAVATDIMFANHGDYRLYEAIHLTATVQQDSKELLQGVIAALNALPAASSSDLVILTDAVTRLSRVTTTPSDGKEAEKGVEAVTAVTRLIRGLSSDTAAIRLQLDELLKILARKWYIINLRETI